MSTEYEKIGNSFNVWAKSADKLLQAANILKQNRYAQNDIPASEIVWSELLLWGYALEVLLKSLLLKNGGKLIKDDKFVGRKNHVLKAMANDAHFSLDDKQINLLERISKVINGVGRYPIGLDLPKTQENVHWNYDEDDDELSSLIEAIRLKVLQNS